MSFIIPPNLTHNLPPVSGAPRELLWYHQMQRESRHLLEQVKRQQVDLDKIKSQSSADQKQREQVQQLLLEFETKQVTATERRREDFEREKEMLKRLDELEKSLDVLHGVNDSQPEASAAVNQWQTLEQRLAVLEQCQTKAPELDVHKLNLRIDALAKAMNNPVKDTNKLVDQHVNHEDKDQAADAGNDTTVTSVVEQVREGATKEKMPSEREPSLQRRPSFVLPKRRPGDRTIPFKPTPSDLGW
ncbi:hypothetical protein KCU85_g4583, partial [Aureobasidium melanogenum]